MSGDVPIDDLPDNLVPSADLPEPGGRYIVEPNELQRRAGIRKNRYKDENLAGNVGRGILSMGEDAGREATLLATGMGAPPSIANAAGFVADAGSNLIPVGGTGKATAAVAAPVLEAGARRVMQSALKPGSKSIANGQAAQAIDTMLEEGIPATAGGAAKLRQRITELKAQVGKVISDSPGALVDKAPVYKELASLLDEIAPLGERGQASADAVRKAWEQFKNHPMARGESAPIPLQQADEIKRAFQKEAKDAYGRTTRQPIDDRIDMATAAGLRKGAEAAAPDIAPINAKIHEYINALKQIEPRAAAQANSELFGLAPIAGSAEGAMLALAQRNPWMKSAIARVLYSGRQVVPEAAGAIGAIAGVEATNNRR